MSQLISKPDGLQVHTPYDKAFVSELKFIIPWNQRRWNKPYWIVDPQYGQDVADLILRFFGEAVSVPGAGLVNGPELKILRIEYIGRCKQVDGQGVASGFCEGSWSVRLPESLLRTWFCDQAPASGVPDETPQAKSLYTTLGIKNFSEFDLIKSAYRRMAKQWHPDRCKEPNATAMFQAITHAYEVLKDDKLRRRYDCGLIFQERAESEATSKAYAYVPRPNDYRAPLRCGLIVAMGTLKLGQFWIEQILQWDDIIDSQNRTMVSSWPIGADSFQIDWS